MKRITCWLMCTVVWVLIYFMLPKDSFSFIGLVGLVTGAATGLWTHYWWRAQP